MSTSSSTSSSSGKSAREVARIYAELAAYPTPKSAQLLPPCPFSDAIRTRCIYQVLDLASQAKHTLVKTAVVVPGTGDLVDSDPVLRDPATVWDVHCSGGDHRAVVLKVAAAKQQEAGAGPGESQYVVQIYNESRYVKSINLTEKAKHGPVYGPELGACQWSYNEGHLLYVAERKDPKKVSYFACAAEEERKDAPSSSLLPGTGDGGSATPPKVSTGRQFDYEENFGEQLAELRHPVLCTLDVDSEVISVLDQAAIPEGVIPTLPCWAPDDTGLVFVGHRQSPYQLGLVYCQQRPCSVYYLHFESNSCCVIGHDSRAVSAPRFSPCQRQLVWLQNSPSGPHGQCRRLIWCDWETKELKIVIDFVKQAGSSGFPGIYTDELPPRCWSSNCRIVVLDSINRSRNCLLAIDVASKLGELLQLPPDASSARVLDFHRDWLVVEASAPNVPPFIAAGFVDPSKPVTSQIRWTCLTECQRLPDIRWRLAQHTATLAHPEFGNQSFESILVWPEEEQQKQQQQEQKKEMEAKDAESAPPPPPPPAPLPLVAFPHGGPNSAFTAAYMQYVVGLARCGYAVLLINYRGSLGFGKSAIVSLLGGIGERDVADCVQAVEEALASSSSSSPAPAVRLDPKRMAVLGGSHGGFLGGHLIGQHPDLFRAAVLRNPVTDLTTMVGTSDIPDWVWEQSGLPFRHGRIVDPESLATLWAKSPLSHVDRVRAPTLIALGAKDRRVPPQQGQEMYRALKARGVPTRLLVYPDDCHPIISVAGQSDAFVNIVLWYNRHVLGEEV